MFNYVFFIIFFLVSFIGNDCYAESKNYNLSFSHYTYITEHFEENGKEMGSCGAAAIVLVEQHINCPPSNNVFCWLEKIPFDAVKKKNKQLMVLPSNATTLPGSNYYESNILGMEEQLKLDSYKTTLKTYSKNSLPNRQLAAKFIFDALAKKHWIILAAPTNLNPNDMGHFYPIFGGTAFYLSNNQIDENKSFIRVINSFQTIGTVPSSTYQSMYQKLPLKDVFDAINKSSYYKNINILEVYKTSNLSSDSTTDSLLANAGTNPDCNSTVAVRRAAGCNTVSDVTSGLTVQSAEIVGPSIVSRMTTGSAYSAPYLIRVTYSDGSMKAAANVVWSTTSSFATIENAFYAGSGVNGDGTGSEGHLIVDPATPPNTSFFVKASFDVDGKHYDLQFQVNVS